MKNDADELEKKYEDMSYGWGDGHRPRLVIVKSQEIIFLAYFYGGETYPKLAIEAKEGSREYFIEKMNYFFTKMISDPHFFNEAYEDDFMCQYISTVIDSYIVRSDSELIEYYEKKIKNLKNKRIIGLKND